MSELQDYQSNKSPQQSDVEGSSNPKEREGWGNPSRRTDRISTEKEYSWTNLQHKTADRKYSIVYSSRACGKSWRTSTSTLTSLRSPKYCMKNQAAQFSKIYTGIFLPHLSRSSPRRRPLSNFVQHLSGEHHAGDPPHLHFHRRAAAVQSALCRWHWPHGRQRSRTPGSHQQIGKNSRSIRNVSKLWKSSHGE